MARYGLSGGITPLAIFLFFTFYLHVHHFALTVLAVMTAARLLILVLLYHEEDLFMTFKISGNALDSGRVLNSSDPVQLV